MAIFPVVFHAHFFVIDKVSRRPRSNIALKTKDSLYATKYLETNLAIEQPWTNGLVTLGNFSSACFTVMLLAFPGKKLNIFCWTLLHSGFFLWITWLYIRVKSFIWNTRKNSQLLHCRFAERPRRKVLFFSRWKGHVTQFTRLIPGRYHCAAEAGTKSTWLGSLYQRVLSVNIISIYSVNGLHIFNDLSVF